MIPEVLIV